MPSPIGPYDGRKARRKRCDVCARRQIKCHGGTPCAYCVRTNSICSKVAPRSTTKAVIFVDQMKKKGRTIDFNQDEDATSQVSALSIVPMQVNASRKDKYLPYFFTSFMSMNMFTRKSTSLEKELLSLSKSSSALRDAIHAVAALHVQNCHLIGRENNTGVDRLEALKAYSRAVGCIQDKITAGTFVQDEGALWVTFLLGLFELMRDSTGTNWLTHFLHGTTTMLRLTHPSTLFSSPSPSSSANATRQTFFFTNRIFEISRSFIFSSPSFLAKPEWTCALTNLWSNTPTSGSSPASSGTPGTSSSHNAQTHIPYHPKESLLTLLPTISSFSIRTATWCSTAPFLPASTLLSEATALADEGTLLRLTLDSWHAEASTWTETVTSSNEAVHPDTDTDMLIAHTYYHATCIYLSGTFDYHPYWSAACTTAILPRPQITSHATSILSLSHTLLAHGVSGLLLFYPLRVAGARAQDVGTRREILHLLKEIVRRGFVVSRAFEADLGGLWMRRDLEVAFPQG